jgi:hypothetical protein
MTNPSPQDQVHHLKESLEESSLKQKAPQFALLIFILLVIAGALVHAYYFRDLPKCGDENIQILLNQELRNNERLLNNSQTVAFGQFNEISHNEVQRECSAELLTTAGTYLIRYQINGNSGGENLIKRLFSKIDYLVSLISVTQIRK